jgi:hypothetical protein
MVHTIALAVILQLSNIARVPATTIADAQAEVTHLYRDIGVDVEWTRHGVARGDSRPTILVVMIERESGALRGHRDTVMGAAVRTAAGTGAAYVFYERVESAAAQFDVPLAFVLAGAIAHEIGHLLLPDGMDGGHSTVGLMRACWNRRDFHRAGNGLLRFSPEQAALIRSRPDSLRTAGSRESCSLPLPARPAPCR